MIKFRRWMLNIVIGLMMVISVGYASQVDQPIQWQTLIWQHIPLRISLPVGKERIIHFPHSAQLGLPSTIVNKLHTERFNGWFYLTANVNFKTTQVQIKDNQTGQIILVQLSASHEAPDTAIKILYPDMLSVSKKEGYYHNTVALQGTMSYKTLTQYAEQQLYGKKRLQKNPYHIQLIQRYVKPQTVIPPSHWLYHLFIDGSVVALPWAQWHGGNTYVTALLIKNQLPTEIDFTKNLVNLCGRMTGVWKAMTVFPGQNQWQWHLAPAGSTHDTAVLFLVSSQPFKEALSECQGGAK